MIYYTYDIVTSYLVGKGMLTDRDGFSKYAWTVTLSLCIASYNYEECYEMVFWTGIIIVFCEEQLGRPLYAFIIPNNSHSCCCSYYYQ